ncbi:hypothetical protein LIER_06901 [Lithospermum erythrorhizon]|uniref:Uncharacterized protein n=1 Tax=Lithospermum erythrorhizon TaxID=34254 RepID=A0AAV3P698_LITER
MDPSFPYFHQQPNNPNNLNNPNNSKQQRPDFNINLGMSSNTPMSSYFPPMYDMSYQGNISYMSYRQPPPPYDYSGGMQEPSMGITNYSGYRTRQIPEVVGDDSSEHHVVEPPTTQRVRGSRTYNSWSTEHNKLLINGWLRYTVTGTSQTSGTFWDAITAFVNQNSPHDPERSSK